MYTVELYARVRRTVIVDGKSERETAKIFGLARETVRKMLRYSAPPGYRRQQPVRRPKLDAWVGTIDQILDQDKARSKKQRHTAKRIFERLRDEHGYTGGYTIVKDYVRLRKLSQREMFVPLEHPPGDAQADFGEAQVVIGGEERKAHYLVVDLPQSDDCFVMAFPAETTEAFLEGHNHAFAYFGGVPRTILYDNTKLAVARILGDGTRIKTRAFTELQSHYLFAEKFGRPGKGNDKGKVEGLVGYARRNFMVPVPRYATWEEFNAHLLIQSQKRRERKLRGHQQTIGERFQKDQERLLPLPASPYEACDKRSTRVTSMSLVRYRANDYSVPVQWGHREVLVKGFVHEVVICAGSEVIARHPRSYEREDMIFDPLHYLALLEQKPNALDQAKPLAGWILPEGFDQIRRLMEARLGKKGKREYVQTLRLLETFTIPEVSLAINDALSMGTISFDAVKHLLLCRIEQRPARLDLENYPHLPTAQVATTAASDYLALLEAR
ncbi:MAG TPA: IS21 family transposase [Acidobacteriaceae bacterium]|nr:IS21 family transposase [Acidobacteriaceae bacterium]